MCDPVTIALATTAVVSTGLEIDSARKAKKAASDQKDSQAIAANTQAAEDALARRAQIRQERIKRSEITADAMNSGAAGSSGESNALSNLSAKVGANLSHMSMQANSNAGQTIYNQQAQEHMDASNAQAALAGSVKQLGSGIASAIKQYQKNNPNRDVETVTEVQSASGVPVSTGTRPIFR